MEIKSFSGEEADKLIESTSLFYGASSRCKALRARKIFGWEPQLAGIETATLEAMEMEAQAPSMYKVCRELADCDRRMAHL